MAIVVEEALSTESNSATSRTINTGNFTPDPSVGDLLVAHFCFSATGATITLPSGWTEIIKTENAGDNLTSQISYKIADSGDAGGQDLTFSKDGGVTDMKLFMMRVTGHRAVSPVATSSGQANDLTATVTAPTLTPAFADSAIVYFVFSDSASGTTSGYTLATSSPSFSELYDTATNNTQAAAAWGIRPEVTATGSGTATISTGTPNNIGQMISISPIQNFTATDIVTATDTFYGSLSAYILDTLTMTDSVTSVITRTWTNITRNIKSWTNQDR